VNESASLSPAGSFVFILALLPSHKFAWPPCWN